MRPCGESGRCPGDEAATAEISPMARTAAPDHSSPIARLGRTGSRPMTDRKNPAGMRIAAPKMPKKMAG
jgi:hypothetical protein